jgi:CRISPR/Cas system CSM-associated protein Csm4 (group 5 of RAMP superfamily)
MSIKKKKNKKPQFTAEQTYKHWSFRAERGQDYKGNALNQQQIDHAVEQARIAKAQYLKECKSATKDNTLSKAISLHDFKKYVNDLNSSVRVGSSSTLGTKQPE